MKALQKLKIILLFFLLTLLSSCNNDVNFAIRNKENEVSSQTQNNQSNYEPLLIGEWEIGEISDILWQKDSKLFFVTHYIYGENNNYNVFAVDVESGDVKWSAENSLSMNFIITDDENYIIGSNINSPILYFRDAKNGNLVYEIESNLDCTNGGQQIISNSKLDEIIYTVNWRDLIGINSIGSVSINEWNIEENYCKKIIQYQGEFSIFDINSEGTKIIYGGKGDNNSAVVIDAEKYTEICQISDIQYGQFIPKQETIAIVREEDVIFYDAISCDITQTIPTKVFGQNLTFSSEGDFFAVINESIDIYNTQTGELQMTIPIKENEQAKVNKFSHDNIKFSQNSRYLVFSLSTSINTGIIQLWQIEP